MAKLRNNEVIRVAELAFQNLSDDLHLFKSFSKSFNSEYLAKVNHSIENLRIKIAPADLTSKIRNAEKRYYQLLSLIKEQTIRIEDLCTLYKQRLIVPRGQFKLYEVRREIRKENVKGIYTGLEATFTAISKNIAHLKNDGFNQSIIQELDSQRKELVATKKELDKLYAEQKDLFAANQKQILQLQDDISYINKYGKLIFQREDAAQKEKYTLAYALSKVRQEVKDAAMNEA